MTSNSVEATTKRKVSKSIADQTSKEEATPIHETVTKKPKIKIVRDFSMPQVEYHKIAVIKELCLKAGIRAKKSEILRAGLKALGEMSEEQIINTVAGLAPKNTSLYS
jgi:hypothetical protein